MNIHEYQAKALLQGLRRAGRRRASPIFSADEAEAAAQAAARPALGGEGADPCRRPRQGQVQGTGRRRQGRRAPRQVDRRGRRRTPRRCSATRWSPTRPARPASRSTASTSRTAPTSRGVLPLAAGRPRDRPHRLRRLDRRRHGHRGRRRTTRRRRSSPSRSIRPPASCRTTAARSPRRSASTGDARQAGREAVPRSSTRPSSRRT